MLSPCFCSSSFSFLHASILFYGRYIAESPVRCVCSPIMFALVATYLSILCRQPACNSISIGTSQYLNIQPPYLTYLSPPWVLAYFSAPSLIPYDCQHFVPSVASPKLPKCLHYLAKDWSDQRHCFNPFNMDAVRPTFYFSM